MPGDSKKKLNSSLYDRETGLHGEYDFRKLWNPHLSIGGETTLFS